ncbi:tetratricopeptide repeat protein [Geobacter sp. SVR]|uniref:tetratricopeptide repeat protein n=1 Tax=Geobacter sp. SVR TaxID=2495594 RepID=UPI00143EFF8B|nr:tetratricopeptide repeat protein [Geobacter sp. SVR]BCS55672.1 hypothetical protein GSVR_39800 [Geobacter sp. SVR]GCF83676.1 hypothetical protein GSbR_02760 [Geobacter sp. SVR]
MRKILSYCLVLSAVLFLCGFKWGFGGNACKDAMETVRQMENSSENGPRQKEAEVLSLCPDGAPGLYVAALQLERVGNVDGAINLYRKALQQQPSFPLASGNLGLLYAQKGMQDEASVQLARGLSSVSNPRYHKAMGRILADRKVYSLAVYHLGEAGRQLPNEADIFVSLAEIYLTTGLTDKALEEYQRAVTADPNQEKARIGMAAIFSGRDDLDRALDELKKAEAVNPQNRETHLMMAGIYEKKGDAKQAEYQYLLGGKGKGKSAVIASVQTRGNDPQDSDAAIESLKASLKDSPEKAAEIYEKIGNLYRLSGKNDEAIAAYREAAYRNSTSSDVYQNLGILYEKNGKLDEAVVSYKQAIQVKPDNADAHLRLADIWNTRGFYQEAVEQYSEFLRLKPDSPDIQLKLARIFAKNKEVNLAIDAYNAVLKNSPDNIDVHREIAPLYRSKGMNDKAEEHYKKVLAQQKDDVEARNALVSIYVKNKQYDEITDLLKGAVELFPDDPNNHYKLGLIYEFRKDYESAITSYKKATEIRPDHARSLNALGRLYMKTGRISEAKEALEAARKADPNLEEATVLLNNIRDEFNPEPRKVSKKLKSSRSKKGKSGKKKAKSGASKAKAAKSGAAKQQ